MAELNPCTRCNGSGSEPDPPADSWVVTFANGTYGPLPEADVEQFIRDHGMGNGYGVSRLRHPSEAPRAGQ